MESSIYEFPAIFRRVHMERPGDIADEVAFMRQIWRRHLRKPVQRVLDIACGDSPHAQILAADGIAVVGIDRSPVMIAAGRSADHENLVSFYRRNIERFTLPERPFDAAFFMSETFPIMRSNADLLSHLKSVARVLKRGAIYCIDIDRHDGVELIRKRRLWRKRRVKMGRVSVDVREFYRPISWCDAMHSIYELECSIHFPDRKVTTRDIIPVRYTTPPLLELVAQASGCFVMIAAYPDLSFERPIEQCRGRWIAVLRRI